MADKPTEKPDAPAPASDAVAAATDAKQPELASTDEAKLEAKDTTKPTEDAKEGSADKEKDEKAPDEDVEMADAADTTAADPDQSAVEGATKTPSKSSSNNRRKSGGGASNRKSLSKKASKARITHLGAQPGDHFLVKLKGFPEWPAIICDESMLPQALLTTRPVTAARPDGTYVENYADGGKRVNDRTFPVMYLHTNEFGWVVNTALTALTSEMAKTAKDGKVTRKDLKAAFELAAEQHPVDHYKEMLQKFEEEIIAHEEALKAAAATPKKSKKSKAKEADDEDEEIVEAGESSKAKAKKRKAEDDGTTAQRSDSVKKPKIKLNTSSTPKAANGTATPSKDAPAAKATKSKPKKSGEKKTEPKESKLTPEERHARKEREVLYLRHKLQRGLLTGNTPPQESEMKQMAEYISILENFSGMEVSIIRATKINKVLKAILKIDSIPREDEFNFKSRSKTLLDKWNKLMADAPTNGVNGASEAAEKKVEPEVAKSTDDKEAESENQAEETTTKKDESAEPDKSSVDKAEAKEAEASEKAVKAPEAVEASA